MESFDVVKSIRDAGIPEQQAENIFVTSIKYLEERFATKADLMALEQRLCKWFDEKLDRKFGEMDQKLDRKFGEMDQKLDRKFGEMGKTTDSKFGEVDKRFREQNKLMFMVVLGMVGFGLTLIPTILGGVYFMLRYGVG